MRGTVEKAVALTPPYNTIVGADREGTLALSFIGLDSSWTYEPSGDHAFSKVSGERALVDGLVADPGERISFTMADGKVQYLNISLHTIAAQPVPYVFMGVPQISMFATIVIMFFASLIIWSLGGLVRTIRKMPHVSGRARLALWFSVLIGILIIAGVAAFIGGISSDIVYVVPPILIVATTLLSVAAIAGLALIPVAVLAWRSRWFTVGGRLMYTLLAVTTPLTLSWVWYWNLLGYQW